MTVMIENDFNDSLLALFALCANPITSDVYV